MCTRITRSTCKALPGCIHCLNFEDEMRVLQELEASGEGPISDVWQERLEGEQSAMWMEYARRKNIYKGRQLYASILPERESLPEGKATGNCQIGWEPQDCPYEKDSARRFYDDKYIRLASLLSVIIALAIVL